MPLQDHMQYVSVDDHVLEPPDLWTSRVPARLRDRAPRLVECTEPREDDFGRPFPAGSEAWLFDGMLTLQSMGMGIAGVPPENRTLVGLRYDAIRPGCFDPKHRVADMDLDGVAVQCCFPTFARFAGTRFLTTPDRALALACVQAYNDFVVDEWCAYAPDRQIPMIILPLWDPAACVAEIERTAPRGVRAVSFPENPAPLGLPSLFDRAWDPMWAAIEAAQLVVCTHIGSSGDVPKPAADAPHTATSMLMPVSSWTTLVSFLLSHVFHEFPGVKVVLSEGGLGWIPAALERADYAWNQRRHSRPELHPTIPPSQLYRSNVFGCLLDDTVGIEMRHRIGVDHICFESDYPHADAKWPSSRTYAEKLLADVPDDEAHRMIEWNARELFRFPRAGVTASAASASGT
jgi:predicted TIM-barrel fold metal-dependent hydrolase